jgi:hypothetical protein
MSYARTSRQAFADGVSRSCQAWEEHNKALTRVVVRQSNRILEMTHIDARHAWAADAEAIESQREAQADAVAAGYVELQQAFESLVAVLADILGGLESLQHSFNSELGRLAASLSSAAESAPTSETTSSLVRTCGVAVSTPPGSSSLPLHDAVPAALKRAAAASASLMEIARQLRLMYTQELAVKEAVVHEMLPHSCHAAMHRLRRAEAATAFAAPVAVGSEAIGRLPAAVDAGEARPGGAVLPSSAGASSDPLVEIAAPAAAVFGLGPGVPGLRPEEEADRDRMTAWASAVSMELCVDAAERRRLLEAIDFLVKRG